MFRIRRASWRALDIDAQNRAVAEAASLLGQMQRREDGESGIFSQLGHKGDLMLVHFRRSFEELNAAEIAIANSGTGRLSRTHDLVSFRDRAWPL